MMLLFQWSWWWTLLLFCFVVLLKTPTLAQVDKDGLQEVRCRTITSEAECESTSDCAFDKFETKRCLGVHGKSCKLLHTKKSCNTNYGCRWAFRFVHDRWKAVCKPFDFQLPAKNAVAFPPKRGPPGCTSFETRSECAQYSGCRPSIHVGCQPQDLILRQSFYFLDGCTQNYDLTRCKDRTVLPFKSTFTDLIDSSWYFIDRVEVLSRVTVHPNQTITATESFAKVFVWYAHDPLKNRYFVYDLQLDNSVEKGFTVFKYEVVNGRSICRHSSPGDPSIATVETILLTSPNKIIPNFGKSSLSSFTLQVPDEKTGEFGVDTGNSSQSATATGVGPTYLIRSTTSDIIADVGGRLESSDVNCEPESELQEAIIAAILPRKAIGLGDLPPSPSPVDPCFSACLELADVTEQQQCIENCAVKAGNSTRAERSATRRLSLDGFIWKTIPESTISQELAERFENQSQTEVEQIERVFGNACRNKDALLNTARILSQTRALIKNLRELEHDTLLPVDINLGNAYSILSLVNSINIIISELDADLGDVASDVQLASQNSLLRPIILPIYDSFNAIRSLINVVKGKLSEVAPLLHTVVRTPLISLLDTNEIARKDVLYASGGVDTFITNPVEIAKCSRALDDVSEGLVQSKFVAMSNTMAQNATNQLLLARQLASQVERTIRAVSIPALQLLNNNLTVVQNYWKDTLEQIIYPLQNVLNVRLTFQNPSICERRSVLCFKVPCGTSVCTERVWCQGTCQDWTCQSQYCPFDIQCAMEFCQSCKELKEWVPCTITSSFTIREAITGTAYLFGRPLTVTNEFLIPYFDALPRPSFDAPPLPSTNAIPPNINAIVAQLNPNVTNQLRSEITFFVFEEFPEALSCGFLAYLINIPAFIPPVSYWTCPPWNQVLQGLLAPVGPLIFSLSWFDQGDLDLIVQTPAGKLISASNPGPGPATNGGALDRDDGVNGPENIFWPSGSPPSGVYHVCAHAGHSDDTTFDFAVDFELKIRKQGAPEEVLSKSVPYPNESPIRVGFCNQSIDSYVTSFRFP